MEEQAGTHPRVLLSALVLVTVVTALVSSLGTPLVPSIARKYDVSIAAAQWTLSIALLAGAVATPLLGRLGGNRLRRPTILWCLALVTVGCALAAMPLGFTALLAGRALQGLGMALSPLAFAVAREALPPDRRGAAVAVLSVSVVAGAGLGFPVTSWIAHAVGLSAAFGVAAVVCAATLLLAFYTVPNSTSGVVDTVDWSGAALLAGGTAALLLAISEGERWGWVSPPVLGLVALSALVLAWWVTRTLRVAHPLVDLRLATRPGLAGANFTGAIAGVGAYLLFSIVTLFVQAPTGSGGLGQPANVVGLLLVPYSLFSVAGSRVVAPLSRRIGPELILPIGCTAYLVAMLVLTRWHDEVWQVAVVMSIAGVGSGATFASMPPLIMRYAEPAETSSAIAFNLVLRILGFSLGAVLAPALLTIYGGSDPLTPTLLTAAAVWAVIAVLSLVLGLRSRSHARRLPS